VYSFKVKLVLPYCTYDTNSLLVERVRKIRLDRRDLLLEVNCRAFYKPPYRNAVTYVNVLVMLM